MRFDWYLALHAMAEFLPALVANAVPIILGGGTPIDLNRDFIDGHRFFGPNKTIRGFISGVATGTLTGAFTGQYLCGFLMASGALLGDLAGSFIKRRLNLAPGKPFPVLDQLDFVLGALVMRQPVFPVNAETALYVILLTPIAHIVTNIFAYLLGLKSVPW